MVVIPAAKGKTPHTADTAKVETTINFLLESSSQQLVELGSMGGFFSSVMNLECHNLYHI